VRDHFDEVYIDAPPTLPFADAAILGAQADGVLMVIRANQTSARHVRTAVEMLAGAPIVGCVLNGSDQAQASYLSWKEPRNS
jgi:Mrp family chromosome partitioning ATPase